MTTVLQTAPVRQSWGTRLLHFPLTKILFAVFLAAASAGLTLSLAKAIADKDARFIWPEIASAIAVLVSYWAYVRYVEKRPAAELSRLKALPEIGAGLLIGAMMVAAEIGILYALGYYEMTGINAWSMTLTQPLAVMIFIGVIEEVIGRGVIFRITEESLGSWPAIVISALFRARAYSGRGGGRSGDREYNCRRRLFRCRIHADASPVAVHRHPCGLELHPGVDLFDRGLRQREHRPFDR